MNVSEPLAVVGPIAVLIPLIVTMVVCAIARREGTPIPVFALLLFSTVTAGAVILSRFVVSPALIVLTTTVLFCVFAIPVMRALEKTVAQRISEEPVRTASLLARDLRSYVPLWCRSAVIVVGLGLLSWVAARSAAVRPSLLTIGYTVAGLTFYGLYEAWIRQEVFSVRARSDIDRQKRVRAIFGAQTTLTILFLLMAGLSAGTWPGAMPLVALGAIAGAIGCAFALSTGIQERYLRAWSVKR